MWRRAGRKFLAMLMITLVAVSWTGNGPTRVQAASAPLALELGEAVDGGVNGDQSYWDLKKNAAVGHTSDEAIYAFSKRALKYNQLDVGGGFMDMGEMARPNGKQTIQAVPVLKLYMEEQDQPAAGHLYVLKTKGLGYYAVYIDDIQEINGSAVFAFTIYKLAGAPAPATTSQPLPPTPPADTTNQLALELGAPIDGGIGGGQNYWDLNKSAAVGHTIGEAIKAFTTRAIVYNQLDVGGGFMDMGEMVKPAGNQTIQAVPVLKIYSEQQDDPTAGHLYVLKTKSLGFYALYMDDIQVINESAYFSFILYPLAKAPYTPTSQPTPTPTPTPTPQPVVVGAPSQLVAVAGDRTVTLTWAAPSGLGVSGYYVYRGTAAGKEDSTPMMDFPRTTTQYTDTKVQNGATYYYIVKAVGKDNKTLSQPSSEVSAKPVAVAPPAPTVITTTIWLQVDNPKAKVNGMIVDLPAPVMLNDKVMVPLRFIGEKIGATVDWNDSQRRVTYILGSKRIELWVDQIRATVDGEDVTVDPAPTSVHDSTFVPLRFVGEKLGAQIAWNSDDMSVTIVSTRTSTPAPTPTPKPEPTPPPQPPIPPVTAGKQVPYWVEAGVRLVIDNDPQPSFVDNDGIYSPVINPEGTLIAYSHGDYQLLIGNFNGEKAVAYDDPDPDYGVYPIAWSVDGKEVMFLTSSSRGFTGGNQLGIYNLDTELVSWVYKGLNSADWAPDGRIVVATSSEMKIVDRQGRDVKKVTPAEGGWFVNADDPTFSPDGQTLIYQLSGDFYLQDIAKDTYRKIITTKAEGDPAHIAGDGQIIYIDKGTVTVYSPDSGETTAYSKSSQCSYPNWMKAENQ